MTLGMIGSYWRVLEQLQGALPDGMTIRIKRSNRKDAKDSKNTFLFMLPVFGAPGRSGTVKELTMASMSQVSL